MKTQMSTFQIILWVIKTIIFGYLWIKLFNYVPAIGKLFMILWYGGLFWQSIFDHRYSAHQTYIISRMKEKLAFIGAWIFQGSSYLSPYAYGLLHRIHHAYTDTHDDPHSPTVDKGPIQMMIRTAKIYSRIFYHEEYQGKPIPEKYKKNLPKWHAFDRIAHSWISRLTWGLIYVCLYVYLGLYVDHITGLQWIIVAALCVTTFVLGPLHGLIVNWLGHKIGYRNTDTKDHSQNIGVSLLLTIPMNFLMMGEDLHNNHHAKMFSPNFAHKWWEYDFIFTSLCILHFFRVVRLKPVVIGTCYI